MSLIDRYVAEVGRHLPEKDRSDIEAEIRSMVDDMVEERGGRAQAVDEKVIAETLEQLGDPRLLAARYAPPKHYLIGPGWYEIYLRTLQRVLYIVLSIFAAVTFILTLAREPLDFMSAAGHAIGGAFEVGLQVFFWITIVFILLERSDEVPEKSQDAESKAWTVAKLPKTPGQRQISIGESITDIVMELFVLLWVILPPVQDWLQGTIEVVPFFNPDLRDVWLPIFFVLMVASLIVDVFKLKIGNWTPALTAANVIVCLASIVYIVALVTTQQVINPEYLATLDPEQLSRLKDVTTWSTWSVNITAAIIVGILIWDMLSSIRMARRLNAPAGTIVLGKNAS